MSKHAIEPLILTPTISRATLSTSSRQDDPSVSVISYRDGKRKEKDIIVRAEGSGPVNPPGTNLQKTAKPFSPEVCSQLTPTLHKFTLPDKVAVVTGCENLHCLILCGSLMC